MNNRWNPAILDPQEDSLDFGDDPADRECRRGHRMYTGLIALTMAVGMIIFVSGFLIGLTTVVQWITQ